ncbi:hypothetical protein AX15_007353 [Amanita polypyramis BW_CC]|nr:hypothetical protein AX15_007353 [Amanita polypyramis BW_CC]
MSASHVSLSISLCTIFSKLWTTLTRKHTTMTDLHSLHTPPEALLDEEGLLKRSSLCCAAGLTNAICDSNVEFRPGQKATKPRIRSAKYLLRQGEYVENWNSPGCDLSELYGNQTPRSLSPSPLLSSSTASGKQMCRFPSKSPTLSSEVPMSSKSLRSPFLSSTSELEKLKSSPILADYPDLVQGIMTDLQPVAYSNNPLSAVTCTFWDMPVASYAPYLSESSSRFCQEYDKPTHIFDVPIFTPSSSISILSDVDIPCVSVNPPQEISSINGDVL